MKICTKCQRELPKSEFRKDSNKKDGLYSSCKECSYLQKIKWYWSNRDHVLEIQRKSYHKHAQKYRIRKMSYRKKNKDRIVSYNKEHNSKLEVKERNRLRAHEWKQRNPDYYAITNNRRRTMLLSSEGNGLKLNDWIRLKERQAYTCLACGRQEPEIKLTVDHIIPISLGGEHDIDNIQGLCLSCNCSKHKKIIDYRPHNLLG